MKRNLLFIMTDQFAYHALGQFNQCIQTPNLDKLAANAIQFSSCYSNSPLCLPSRASLATGLYPEELEIVDNYSNGLTSQSQTWMQHVRDAGYETSVFGKVHLHKFCPDLRDREEQTMGYGYQIVNELPGPRTYGKIRSYYYDYLEQQGILECYIEDMKKRYEEGPVYDCSPTPLPVKDYADVYIAARALEYLDQVSDDRPWFCTVSFGGPHDPWDAPKEYTEYYQNMVPPAPLPPPKSMNPSRPRGVYDELLNGTYDPSLTEDLVHMTQEDIVALRRSYYAHVTLIDEQIGCILDCLKKRKMLDNTIIVFTSDHGEENGDYGLLFKQTFFESSVRVPLMIFVPGQEGVVVKQPVELMDLGPTLCDLLEIPCKIGHARSLMPLLDGVPFEKKCIVSQIFGETMMLEESVKVIFNCNGVPYMVFDLEQDSKESYNLAGTEGAALMELEFSHKFSEWKRGLV